MGCESLLQQTVALNVSAGSLPEGFCPASMNELFQAMAARLIVTPNQSFTSFAMGSVEPTSNVGPWLKDCEEWFIFDESIAGYRPITKGGFDNMEYFTNSGSFIVPDFIFKIRVKIWGAGGGGNGQSGASAPGSGGGGGGMGQGIFNVVPGQVIPYTIGAGGAGGISVAGPGSDGGSTTFLTMVAGGGKGATVTGGFTNGGFGGQVNGATMSMQGGGGDAGNNDPGVGGGSPQGGSGGVPYSQNALEITINNGIVPGGGGAGGNHSGTGSQLNGGSGAGGAVLIEY